MHVEHHNTRVDYSRSQEGKILGLVNVYDIRFERPQIMESEEPGEPLRSVLSADFK